MVTGKCPCCAATKGNQNIDASDRPTDSRSSEKGIGRAGGSFVLFVSFVVVFWGRRARKMVDSVKQKDANH